MSVPHSRIVSASSKRSFDSGNDSASHLCLGNRIGIGHRRVEVARQQVVAALFEGTRDVLLDPPVLPPTSVYGFADLGDQPGENIVRGLGHAVAHTWKTRPV